MSTGEDRGGCRSAATGGTAPVIRAHIDRATVRAQIVALDADARAHARKAIARARLHRFQHHRLRARMWTNRARRWHDLSASIGVKAMPVSPGSPGGGTDG